MEAYIVVKKRKEKTNPIPLCTNEAVFTTYELADAYVGKRKALKDRDDRGCTFSIEPWHINNSLDM